MGFVRGDDNIGKRPYRRQETGEDGQASPASLLIKSGHPPAFPMSSLKKIYVAANAVDAHMFKELLEQEGVQSVVRGDDFVPLQGGSLFTMETRPSVWVFDDEHVLRARELADDFRRRATSSDETLASWTCRCGETIEEQFTECWSCRRPKPDARD